MGPEAACRTLTVRAPTTCSHVYVPWSRMPSDRPASRRGGTCRVDHELGQERLVARCRAAQRPFDIVDEAPDRPLLRVDVDLRESRSADDQPGTAVGGLD